MKVTLEKFDPELHSEMLKDWLRLPHVARWWIDPTYQFSICLNRDQPLADHRLIAVDETPVGYIRWEPLYSKDLAPYVDVGVPVNVTDLDILIADTAFIGCGVGPRALSLLQQLLLEQGSSNFLMLAVSIDNTNAIRAYEKSGFTKVVEFDGGKYGPSQLMSTSLQ